MMDALRILFQNLTRSKVRLFLIFLLLYYKLFILLHGGAAGYSLTTKDRRSKAIDEEMAMNTNKEQQFHYCADLSGRSYFLEVKEDRKTDKQKQTQEHNLLLQTAHLHQNMVDC